MSRDSFPSRYGDIDVTLPPDDGGNRVGLRPGMRPRTGHREPQLLELLNGGTDVSWWRYGILAADARCGGNAVATKSVASSTPIPSGVGIDTRNGTTTRVAAIGASQASMSR